MSDAVYKVIKGNQEASELHRIAYGKEMYNAAIDHAIEIVSSDLKNQLGYSLSNTFVTPYTKELISKLEKLKQ